LHKRSLNYTARTGQDETVELPLPWRSQEKLIALLNPKQSPVKREKLTFWRLLRAKNTPSHSLPDKVKKTNREARKVR
jgi:hypothetical protein